MAFNFDAFAEMNNILTASRINSLLKCARQHFWAYEVGLRSERIGIALKIGSAWARAMEARWHGKTYEETLAYAMPDDAEFDAHTGQKIAALIAGYFCHYGPIEQDGQLQPEVQIPAREIPDTDFKVSGVIDALGQVGNRTAIIEGKTTGDSIDDGSDYWLRLRFNIQLMNYVSEARHLGLNPEVIFYDVCRKPSIKPMSRVYDLDEQGRKIVVDTSGERVFKKKKITPEAATGKKVKGKTVVSKPKKLEPIEIDDLEAPIQSANKAKGWTVKEHEETPQEFGERLFKDIQLRPLFYFARREVPILDDEVVMFERQRMEMAHLISHFRAMESSISGIQCGPLAGGRRDPEAWPRNVSTDTCDFCQFKSFCLLNINPDIARDGRAPEGYQIKSFHPELEKATNTQL